LAENAVCPKTTVQQMPAILAVQSVEIGEVLVVEVLCKDSMIRWVLSLIFPPYCTMPNPCTWVPPPAVSKPPRVSAELFVITLITPFTALAPHTVPPGPRIYLDAVNVLERHVHHVPINAAEKGRIDGSAIDQHLGNSPRMAPAWPFAPAMKRTLVACGMNLRREETTFSVGNADVSDPAQVRSFLASVENTLGAVDVLVNNAGTILVGPLEHMTVGDFEEVMSVNFWGAVHTTMGVLPGMKQRHKGRIVNITSIGGKVAFPHLLPYTASKFALVGFSEGLGTELAKDGIWVTTVVPNLMRTGSPRNADFKGAHKKEYAWFTITDSLPGVSVRAEHASRQIIRACQNGCRGSGSTCAATAHGAA